MFSEKLLAELNTQIMYEFYSAHYYLAMAAYCASEDLDGFENFFKVQADEEHFHAMKFYDYINEMGGRVEMKGFKDPKKDYASMVEVFSLALEHEKFVTKRIYQLMDLATEEKEHATISFLKWFIDEQVEEEATMNGVLKKLERFGEGGSGIMMLDSELAQRTFTPPAANQQ